jgi:hypothetical protein
MRANPFIDPPFTAPEAVAREKRAKDEAEAKRKAAIPNF